MTMAEALQVASDTHARREEGGFDQAALDEAARTGLANGEFEETEDEVGTVVEEFYPNEGLACDSDPQSKQTPSLIDKLGSKLSVQTGAVS